LKFFFSLLLGDVSNKKEDEERQRNGETDVITIRRRVELWLSPLAHTNKIRRKKTKKKQKTNG
jgi:hypothetical protein